MEEICYTALLLTFLIHIPVFLDMNSTSDYGLYPLSNLKTADGNFHLMHQWKIGGNLELYRCNAFEFDCQKISEFEVGYSENCRPFHNWIDDSLMVGPNGRLEIMNRETGLTYPVAVRATVKIDCINQTMAVVPW